MSATSKTWAAADLAVIILLKYNLQLTLFNRNIAIIQSSVHMGASRSDIFTSTDQAVARAAKALAHPARVAILQHLRQQPGCVCGDIVHVVGLAQSTVSQHLKVLKETGIIQGSIEGPRVCYCIDPEGWAQARMHLSSILSNIKTVPEGPSKKEI